MKQYILPHDVPCPNFPTLGHDIVIVKNHFRVFRVDKRLGTIQDRTILLQRDIIFVGIFSLICLEVIKRTDEKEAIDNYYIKLLSGVVEENLLKTNLINWVLSFE